MYFGVKEVKAKDNYKLLLTFENDEVKEFDVSKYLEIGKFSELKNESLFKSVRISFDTIEWANGLDIDPETLYIDSKNVN